MPKSVTVSNPLYTLHSAISSPINFPEFRGNDIKPHFEFRGNDIFSQKSIVNQKNSRTFAATEHAPFMDVVFHYLIAINVLTFAMYGLDKWKASRHWWRIPEWVLMTSAAVGGSIGAWVGMNCFHHKTMKPLFRYGIPLILLLQIAAVAYMIYLKR